MTKNSGYTTATPDLTDKLFGTDVSDVTTDAGGKTANFTVQSIFDLFDDQNVTFTGSIAMTGSFTPASMTAATGSIFKITHTDVDQGVEIWGGTEDNGSGLLLFGDTHATQANDIDMFDEGDLVYRYDSSASSHSWYEPAGTIAMLLNSQFFYTNRDSIRIATAKTPASAAATGAQGQVAWDSSYLYVCIAANTWKRVGISTW